MHTRGCVQFSMRLIVYSLSVKRAFSSLLSYKDGDIWKKVKIEYYNWFSHQGPEDLQCDRDGEDITVWLVLFPAHWQQVQSHVIILTPSPRTPPRIVISLLDLTVNSHLGRKKEQRWRTSPLSCWWDTPWCLHHQLLIQTWSHCRSSGPWWDLQLYFKSSLWFWDIDTRYSLASLSYMVFTSLVRFYRICSNIGAAKN